MLAHVLESDLKPVADIVFDRRRHRDTARAADAFNPRRDVDAVPENVSIFGNHVAKMNSNAQLDAPVLWDFEVSALHLALHRKRALDRIDDAWEFGKQSIAGQ